MALAAAVGGACYWAPPLVGPYRCTESTSCGAGLICDDGLCCSPLGTPLCPAYVFDGGLCADGGRAQWYYPDPNHQGQPDPSRPKLFCAPPVLGDYVPSCEVPGMQGVCKLGALLDGGTNCKQLLFPTQDLCDGLDNNCNGQVDERPDCGGPADLLGDPTVTTGVKHLASAGVNGFVPPAVTNCAAGLGAFFFQCGVYCPLTTAPPCAINCCPAGTCAQSCIDRCTVDTFILGVWQGARLETHLLYFESNTGVPWDLSRSNLAVGFNYQVQSTNSGPPADPWWQTPPAQPVVLFCGETDVQFAGRNPLTTVLINKVPTEVALLVPAGPLGRDAGCDAVSGWCGYNSPSPLDLRHVKRVEFLVAPAPAGSNGGGPALFQITLRDAGFR